MEHGNLEISFEEKSGLQREGKYYEALRQKQLDPVLGARKVHIQYEFKGNEFKAVIRDEGKGFDHRKQAQIKVAELGQLQHGRGLLLARAEFDSVTYNDAGNAVTVTKKFASAPESGLH
ncbi:MAG TPA: ATP-binding protein [Leptospiraceae bacterium]|nr:ATP-binding protein [Leptospiraceae bacterium]